MFGKNEIRVECTGVSKSDKYVHYEFTSPVFLRGNGLDEKMDFRFSIMISEDQEVPFEYGKKYEFNLTQG